ncbi:DUF3954 domain-containing protein [Bacillus sp. ISL-35]|uniref:DUF3954 domain-containing protein n=1 Tax=Bacillus sp. ISL-35 TaxID=2819122 RepID=UPI001BEA1FAA|nr:DUF3954 domain-containing protein [Chryseobacterium sp. ISL-80]
MKANAENMTAEIDLMVNATYIVKDGQLVIVDTPPKGYGKQVISWQSGKPSHYELNYSNKL